MSADLLARLIAAGTEPALVAEVAMALASAKAAADARVEAATAPTKGALRMRSYRARGGDQIPGWMRQQVMERDDWSCCDCHAETRLECDHVVPLAAGGETTLENLQVLCRSCNARKRDRIRKSEKRGQSRTISGNGGNPAMSEENPTPSPSPLPFPQTPKLTPHPLPHPEGTDARTRKARPAQWPCPEGVDPTHWADLIANRKSRRLANTATAHAGILRDLAKHSDEEWPPGRIVQHAAERGWGAIFDPRPSTGTRNGQRSHHHHRNGSRGLLGAVLDEEHAGRA